MKGREARELKVDHNELRTLKDVQHEGPKDLAAAHVELVREGESVSPVVFLPRPKGFRAQPDELTLCTVAVDVVAVANLTEILGCVVPVLWDRNEPRWETVFLNLFPVVDQDEGGRVSIALSREILSSFGFQKTLCRFIVFYEDGSVLLERRLPVEEEQRKRLAEIHEVIAFLDGYDIEYEFPRLRAAQEFYRSIFYYTLAAPVPRIFPTDRSPLFSDSYIRHLCVDHGRLIDRKSILSLKHEETELRYDLFISYCHLDATAADRIAAWIKKLWPGLRIFVSDPDDVQRNENDANYFLKDARNSKVLLYIATPNSVGRPVVSQEIGTNRHKPIVTVIVGEGTRVRLRDYLSKTPFLSLDPEWTVELDGEQNWRKFAWLLAQALSEDETAWGIPPEITTAPLCPTSRMAAQRSFGPDDWNRIKSRIKEQSPEEAERIVNSFLAEGIKNDEFFATALRTQSASIRLILVLEKIIAPEFWHHLLDLVPALVDEELVRNLEKRVKLKRINQEEATAEKLDDLLTIVGELIQFWSRTMEPDP